MNGQHLSLLATQGDPGFFDVLKKIGRGVTRFGGAIPVIGGTVTTVGGIAGFGPPPIQLPSLGQVPGLPTQGNVPILRVPGVAGVLQRAIPGGLTGLQIPGQGLAPGVKPSGFHVNKSSYFLKSGEFVPAGTRFVRNRTRNNANGKALTRATRRVQGFNNQVKRSRKALRALARI